MRGGPVFFTRCTKGEEATGNEAASHGLLARTLKQQFPESETPVIAGPQF